MNAPTYESHVTTEPLKGLRLDAVTVIAEAHGFEVSGVATLSSYARSFEDLNTRLIHLRRELRANEFMVTRYSVGPVRLGF